MTQMHIDPSRIRATLEHAKSTTDSEISAILTRAETFGGLTPLDVAKLLMRATGPHLPRLFEIAGKIKASIYGDRVVMFAPLYVSDYCVNACVYCGYNCKNNFNRRRLTIDEVRREAAILERMGHKRLALEAGEDPVHCPIDYILDVIRALYEEHHDNGEIRRVNVNIAATTPENYRRLHDVGIGTYILFQETYDPETYTAMHPAGPKHDYRYHLTAFDRAMEAGIDDVGAGVLFGLADPAFEVLGLMLHNEHLENTYGQGFHTISVPRLCPAEGMDLSAYPHILSDEEFLRLVAIIRLAVPYTGMIISTRESAEMRKSLIRIGVSQLSAGSSVEVGGYDSRETGGAQFHVADERSMSEILNWLMDENLVPSFCTACYRQGRTGDRFMQLAKSGNIKNVCLPNALCTLCEYAQDYGDDALRAKVDTLVASHLPHIESARMQKRTAENLARIRAGERDLYV